MELLTYLRNFPVMIVQVTDQIQIYMRKTLQNDYGVNLDEQWNHFVTESWNKAQAKVGTLKMYYVFTVKYHSKISQEYWLIR